MANRHTLHISKLEPFTKWLRENGWEIHPLSRNIYEVLRATKEERKDPLIIYQKADAKEHLTVVDRDYAIVKAFLRDEKKPKTNGDRIRAMSDKELAKFIANDCLQISDAICGPCPQTDNLQCGNCVCEDYIEQWLQKETEET